MADYTTIDDPSVHFQVTPYTGNGSNAHSITNIGNSNLQPDLLWYKSRSYASSNILYDSSEGVDYFLTGNTTAQEKTDAQMLESFDSNGFTLNADTDGNRASNTFIARQWKMNGGTTASNSDGNITSTVQANTLAGQSIVNWTGNENSSATVGHGLDQAPETVIYKRRNNNTYNWTASLFQLGAVGSNSYVGYPNLTNSWEQTSLAFPTSTVLKPGNGAPQNSGEMVAYCFHSVQGYSKMGSYYGNGSGNGPFIYTGFKPAFVWLKGNQANHWIIYEDHRPGWNDYQYELYSNNADAEYTGASYFDMDLYSNGFKCKLTDPSINANNSRYAYLAFAENPFVTSTGIPTTAR